MKFGYFILILASLFILQLQPSDAVQCPAEAGVKNGIFTLSGSTQCDACAVFSCAPNLYAGCADDALFQKCPKHSSNFDDIKSKSPKNMYYFNNNGTFIYVSGCSGESDGTKCMYDLNTSAGKESDNKKKNGEYVEPVWGVNPAAPPPNDSNNQNGALKLIGIISIGWILATAWIY
uniref:Sodefrin-like factor n=1 Tax=Panagrolaimus sp. ES5 TaxID=591445 RepID=A0AC34F632_9BILA